MLCVRHFRRSVMASQIEKVISDLNDKKAKIRPNAILAIKAVSHLSIDDAIDAFRNGAILLEGEVDRNKEKFMAETLVSEVTN